MSTSEESPGETLADLRTEERVRLAVGDRQFEGTARRKTVAGDRVRAVVETGDDHVFRITSEWVQGWLDPLVDEYVADDRVQPVGTAAELELVDADGP
ncbi:hypothetical protein [Halobacterium yunchengense]|uniref:hypothetical protein n=1 Tax=Halobacterium yunchengense TaxID=3108497 RepID=UPI0030081F4C